MAHKFPESLKKLMKEKKITQEILAEKIGITKNPVVRYGLGEAEPRFIHLMKIIDALECSPNELLGWEPGRKMAPEEKDRNEKSYDTAS